MVSTAPRDVCVTVPPTAFTVAGFRAWRESADFPTRGRVTLCEGEVLVDMTPERAESHTLVKGEIHATLLRLVRSRDLGRIYADGLTYTNETAGLVTEPDAVFFTWESLRSGRVQGGREHHEPLGVQGVVDWLLEVVSPSSVRKDRDQLFRSYARAGVPEYWIVDALGAQPSLEIYRLHPEGYRLQPDVDSWQESVVFGASFRLERSSDSGGGWQFALRARPQPGSTV